MADTLKTECYMYCIEDLLWVYILKTNCAMYAFYNVDHLWSKTNCIKEPLQYYAVIVYSKAL